MHVRVETFAHSSINTTHLISTGAELARTLERLGLIS